MKKILRFLSYVLVAAMASCLTLLMAVPQPQQFQQPQPGKLEALEALILERFIGEADPVVMGDAAANAMIASLGDRWSYYIPASSYDQYTAQMKNEYVGIGITITRMADGSGFLIEEVVGNGPAAEAGMQAGDVVVAVQGQSVAGTSLDEVSALIKGDQGTSVDVTVLRQGAEHTMTVQRRQIKVAVAVGQLLDGNVGLVTIENFDERCAEETIAAIESLLEQGADKLLFDVRNNPGGYKRELVKVLDYLLPQGPLFRSLSYDGTETVDSSDESCVKLPMAVLVNGSSYSAAEFFAAAIREYEAGFVVGTQTCGKGYFQTTHKLPDGSAVGLSVGKYFTPNGVCLADVGGLTPDVVVEVDGDTAAQIKADLLPPENDPQIQAALEQFGK